MFFPLMNTQEKKKCLALFYGIAMCDNELHKNEKDLLSGYSILMGLDGFAIQESTIEECINYFATRSDLVKKAVFIECCGMIFSDGRFHEKESEAANLMIEKFGFDRKYFDDCREWLASTLPMYYRGFELLGFDISKTK